MHNKKNRWAIIALIAATWCLLYTSEAKAQVRFGLKGGYELTNMEFSTDAINRANRSGFFAGPTLKIGMPVTGLSIDVSGLYNKRDLKVKGEDFTQQSLLLQGDARYGVGIGDIVNIFILAGPQFSFNVGEDVKHWFADDGELKQFSLQETLLSINMGMGVTLAKHLEGSIRYNVPISKTADFTWSNAQKAMTDEVFKHAKTRSNAWSATLTYYF